MADLENPATDLAAVVVELYDLAGNSEVPPEQQQKLLIMAHDLRGDLVTLVAMHFTQETRAYTAVMAKLGGVTAALETAEEDITKAIGVVNGAAALASSIDALLKEAVKVAGHL